ncbi:short-chain dehydrogenase, partial [Streptomyces sp. NPDC002491]
MGEEKTRAAETQQVTETELAAFHQVVGKLRALPVDDPVRLHAERVAASFARDGWRRRRHLR